MELKLYEHQEKSQGGVRQAYREGFRRALLVSPVASGKTVIFASITEGCARTDKRVTILVHRKELLEQCDRALHELGVPHGLISPRHTQTIDRVQVASVGTLIRRLDKLPEPDLVIVDECFPAGTLIDGIPIENISTGDTVTAYDHHNSSVVKSTVSRVFKSRPKELIRMQFGKTDIVCTSNHPIYSLKHMEYLPARDMQIGDFVVLKIGRQKKDTAIGIARLESIEILKPGSDGKFGELCSDGYVYNLEVERYHNYFANGVLVHNCHHVAASTWDRIVTHYSNSRLLGVTATPCRLDGKGLARYYDTMVMGPSVQELIALGYLSRPVVYAPPSSADFSQVGSRYGDFAKGQVNDIVDTPKIIGDAVDHYMRLCNGVPAIAFCCTIDHARHTAECFNAAGVTSRCVDGTMNNRDREACINGLANGDIQVLTSCDIVSEGTDIPVVGAAILLRPTQSLALYIQQVGRAMRIYPGKKNTIVLDHVGNFYRHGFPDDDREWKLTSDKIGTSKREGDIRYRTCMFCFVVIKNPRAKVCPQCGHEIPTAPGRDITEEDGELQLMSQREYQGQMWNEYVKMQDKNSALRRSWQADSVEELKEIAQELGYNPKWAYVRWKLIQKKRDKVKETA